jgi:hypothetical protein
LNLAVIAELKLVRLPALGVPVRIKAFALPDLLKDVAIVELKLA